MTETEHDGRAAIAEAIESQLKETTHKMRVQRAGAREEPSAHVDGEGRFIINGAPNIAQLPPDAPVRALGTFGNKVYFLDAHSQLRELAAKDVSRTMILHLFGDQVDWIYKLWPTLRAKPGGEQMWIVTGWDGTKAQESLMTACARRGVWRPQDHVRGRGMWRVGEKLMLHSGNRLHMSDGTVQRPGLMGEMVYPAAPIGMEPAKPGTDGRGAASEILTLIESWNFAREIDARLLLGWIVAAMMAGALKVRPLVWVTGEKGTGKSSLVGEEGLIHKLFAGGILMTANTTAAGLYQKIGYDSLPVAVDEIEAKRGNQKTEAVIELARQAYSGGMVLRGGQDHEGKEFRAMCPVLFGSILIPPLMPQDLSRLALLNLKPFDADAVEPVLDGKKLAESGRNILRRVLDMWDQWPERFGAWHGYLRALGHSGRAADQFGTLLAAADLVLCDGVPSEEEMSAVAGGMAPTQLHETQVESSNAARCVGYAMSRPLSSMRGGEHMMVSELVACAVRRYGGEMENPVKPLDAVRYLERAGVSVVVVASSATDGARVMKAPRVVPHELADYLDGKPGPNGIGAVYIAFAPSGDGILELFKGSDWEGVPGAHNPYVQALERVTGAWRAPGPIRMGGQVCKPILIPIEQCIDVPAASEAKAPDPA